MILKAFIASELNAVVAINNATAATDWTQAQFEQELSAPQRISLVAKMGKETVGFIFSSFVVDELTILAIAVSERYQRRGVANALLEQVLETAREAGCSRTFLEVRASNIGAIGLYQSRGFCEVGIRPGYYRKPVVEDAVQMERSL